MFEKILERLEDERRRCERNIEHYKARGYIGASEAYRHTEAEVRKIKQFVQEVAKECGNASDNDLAVVSALPSLYSLHPFEEEAIQKVVVAASISPKDNRWIPLEKGVMPDECEEVDVTIEEIDGDVYTTTSWLQDGVWVVKKNEFPCKVGDTVYVKECCEVVSISRDWESGVPECPFENECEFEECKEENERLFKTCVESIWNNGQGWYFSVRGLHLEIPIIEFGKKVFLICPQAEEALTKSGAMCNLSECINEYKNNAADSEIEQLWEELADVPVDEDEHLDVDWKGWSKGTHRDEIWHWFDKNHSKGIGWLVNEYEPK